MLKEASQLGIDALADEILRSKIAERAGARSVTWDCDDLVFLDFDTLRIALHDVPETPETPNVICLAVGPVPGKSLPTHINSASLAHALVKRFTQIIQTSAVLWHEDNHPLSTSVMDNFQSELDKMLGYLDLQMQGTTTPKEQPEESAPRNSALKDQASLDDLRGHLQKTGQVGSSISLPIHVSLYVLACTFFFMLPAFGSALLSYIWLRDGVDKPSTPS